MDTASTAQTQAANAAGAPVQAQGAVLTQGAFGNTAGNDSVGLTMDFDAIDGALYGGQAIEVPSTAVVPANGQNQAAPVITNATVQTQTQQGDQTPVVTVAPTVTETSPEPVVSRPEPTGPGAGERILPARIGTGQFAPATQRAMALMHELNGGKPEGEGAFSLVQCIEMVTAADSGQPISLTPATTTTTAAPVAPSAIDSLRMEVSGLEARIREAGENQSLFGSELAQATIDLADKKAQLAAYEVAQKQSQEAQINAHVSARQVVKAQVLKDYPTADTPNSILGSRVATLIEELKSPAHPDHKLLEDVNAPKLVVEMAADEVATQVAKQFGITKEAALATLRASQAPVVPVTATNPSVPPPVGGNRDVTVTAPGTAGLPSAPRPATEAEILAASAANPDSIDSMLGYGSGGLRFGG